MRPHGASFSVQYLHLNWDLAATSHTGRQSRSPSHRGSRLTGASRSLSAVSIRMGSRVAHSGSGALVLPVCSDLHSMCATALTDCSTFSAPNRQAQRQSRPSCFDSLPSATDVCRRPFRHRPMARRDGRHRTRAIVLPARLPDRSVTGMTVTSCSLVRHSPCSAPAAGSAPGRPVRRCASSTGTTSSPGSGSRTDSSRLSRRTCR
jgi:hypothetical protein